MKLPFKSTKIVCTIGPASWDKETLTKLAKAGMDIVRLNMSHGAHEEKSEQIKHVRNISRELGKTLMVFADLQGPKLRLGKIDGIRPIKKGEKIDLVLNSTGFHELPMQFDLSPFMKKGQRIYLNDGLVEIKVTDVIGKTIRTIAVNDGVVSSNKGVNVPDTLLKGAAFTQKDHDDAVFALENDVDYIALSFVQTVEDLKPLKELIKKHNPRVKIIVKIEKNEAVDNLEEILSNSDAVMVARGDLAIETDNTTVPIVQQKIIKLARQLQKPVIVATQMLESMTENPRPTRAEVSDVATAVMDQADCVMLSAESASGKYPVEAVETMNHVIETVEANPEQKHYIKINWERIMADDMALYGIASAACSLAFRVKAKAIVVGTATGRTAQIISAFRPDTQIIAVTHDDLTKNQLNLVWGVKSVIVKPTTNFNTFVEHIFSELEGLHEFKRGDKLVIVTGLTAGVSGTTNTIKIATL
jgi:pyruvate kinase